MKTAVSSKIDADQILNSVPDAIQCVDTHGRIVLSNRAATELFGWAPEECVGKSHHQFFQHSRADGTPYEKTGCPLCELIRDFKEPATGQIVLVSHDGQSLPIEFDSVPMRKGKRCVGTILTLRNLSRQIGHEEALLSMRKAVETMQLGVTITDPEGHILYINPAEADMHGYEISEVIGKNVRIFAPQELWEPMTVDEIRQIVSFRRETVNRRKDGTLFPIQLTSDAVLNAEGNPIAIVTTSENITERKLAEDQLRRAHDELDRRVQERTLELTESIALLKEQINKRRHAEDALRNAKDMLEIRVEQRTRELAKINKALEMEASHRKQANEALERLVSGVAHEVRSPLFAISTSTQTLSKKVGNVREYSPYIEMILSQVKRLSNLMMDLLEVGRPPQTLLKTPQNMRDILLATKANVVAVTPQAEEMIAIAEETENVAVLGNREKLIQAFFNLMQNAVQHAPEKTIIGVHVVSDIENVRIAISDQGGGIPDQHLDRIFQPFFTLRKDGIGLGLSITKSILDSHGGTIRVFNNTPPPGCTFEVSLPSHRESQT